ncbi:MAG: PIN domain-containing protein [Thermodesulfobacteriota bacterium]|nr:PIN domain-containing protein [Thermodesulfobacteriota bacterium]
MTGLNLQPDSSYFVDTNIWLYSFIASQDTEKSSIAKTIISENDIVISTQIVNEMSVNLLRKANFTEKRIQELIVSLYKRYTVLELSSDILIRASEIRSKFSFSYWDSIVAASALDSEADYLISEDMQNGFSFDGILTIINPFL